MRLCAQPWAFAPSSSVILNIDGQDKEFQVLGTAGQVGDVKHLEVLEGAWNNVEEAEPAAGKEATHFCENSRTSANFAILQ